MEPELAPSVDSPVALQTFLQFVPPVPVVSACHEMAVISVQPWHLVMRTIGLLLVTVALLLSPIILPDLPSATNVGLVACSPAPNQCSCTHAFLNGPHAASLTFFLDSLSFSPSFDEPVAMHIAYSTHYQHDADEGAEEFARLIPDGGHVVYIDDDPQSPSHDPSPLARHCMNYLRQSILCRPHLIIEPARNTGATAFRSYETVRRDWSKVYAEANRNHEAYSRRKG